MITVLTDLTENKTIDHRSSAFAQATLFAVVRCAMTLPLPHKAQTFNELRHRRRRLDAEARSASAMTPRWLQPGGTGCQPCDQNGFTNHTFVLVQKYLSLLSLIVCTSFAVICVFFTLAP